MKEKLSLHIKKRSEHVSPWGILKREMYYGKRFTSKEELIQSIQDYIEYYNNRRLQRKLHIMTPMAFHELTLKAA